MPSPNFFDLLKKKYSVASQTEKTKIILEVKTSINLIFQIQYPKYDDQPIIKEFYGCHWRQEIEIKEPEKAYLKIFITKPVGTIDSFVTLKMYESENSIIEQKLFQIEEDPTTAKWFKIEWKMKSLCENTQEIVEN